MKILSLDTSTPRRSVALLDGQELAAELRLHSMETHSARLLADIDFLLGNLHWKLEDLNLIAAGIGPGSFTGIRIGVATGLGLAQSLFIPFAGISDLDALAFQLSGIDGRIGVAMDAQRAQIYYAEYMGIHGRIRRSCKPSLVYPAELEQRLRGKRLYVIGDGAYRYAADLNLHRTRWPRLIDVSLFLAAPLGRLALKRRQSWRSGESLQAEPLYIRPPDAQRRKAK